MAALVFCVCGALNDLYEFTDAFKRCNCDYRRTIKYLTYKKRVRLFRQYCREFYANFQRRNQINSAKQNNLLRSVNISKKIPRETEAGIHRAEDEVDNISITKDIIMNKKQAGIDFAAIEASAEAFEAIDTFAAKSGSSSMEFIEVERQYTGFREGYCFEDEDIEIIEGVEDDTILYTDADDEPIYSDSSLDKLHEGVSFTVNGKTMRNCERFSINFIIENNTRDIALHINPRLPQNYIVRNSKVRNAWGREEVASALPFSLRRGAPFSIQVLFTDDCYMISVNGFHFCKFYHRLPYKSVQTLEVKGEIEDVTVERQIVLQYPERLPESVPKAIRIGKSLRPVYKTSDSEDEEKVHENDSQVATQWNVVKSPSGLEYEEPTIKRVQELKLPFYGVMPLQAFKLGRVLKVEGRVRLLPQSFYINLQSGHNCWPHPVTALHLNPRFNKQSSGAIGRVTVIRNSWVDGAWGTEERSDLDTSFRPGKAFSLSIVHGCGKFEIYVNHQLLTEYKFRVSSRVIDTVYIQGDIKLFNVVLEENVSFSVLPTSTKRSSAKCPE